jgi:hypothetical protein
LCLTDGNLTQLSIESPCRQNLNYWKNKSIWMTNDRTVEPDPHLFLPPVIPTLTRLDFHLQQTAISKCMYCQITRWWLTEDWFWGWLSNSNLSTTNVWRGNRLLLLLQEIVVL